MPVVTLENNWVIFQCVPKKVNCNNLLQVTISLHYFHSLCRLIKIQHTLMHRHRYTHTFTLMCIHTQKHTGGKETKSSTRNISKERNNSLSKTILRTERIYIFIKAEYFSNEFIHSASVT